MNRMENIMAITDDCKVRKRCIFRKMKKFENILLVFLLLYDILSMFYLDLSKRTDWTYSDYAWALSAPVCIGLQFYLWKKGRNR